MSQLAGDLHWMQMTMIVQPIQLADAGDQGAQDRMRFSRRFAFQEGNKLMWNCFRLLELLLEYKGDHSVWDYVAVLLPVLAILGGTPGLISERSVSQQQGQVHHIKPWDGRVQRGKAPEG